MNDQQLTDQQIRHLLVMCMAFDNRKPSEAQAAAWAEAARIARWDFDDAKTAITEHYTESTDFCMPGHITSRIKANRRQPAPPTDAIALPAAPPANPERVGVLLAQVGKQLGWQPKQRRHPALDQRCPHCHAAPGRPCTRRVERGHRAGQNKPLAQPHPSRIDLVADSRP